MRTLGHFIVLGVFSLSGLAQAKRVDFKLHVHENGEKMKKCEFKLNIGPDKTAAEGNVLAGTYDRELTDSKPILDALKDFDANDVDSMDMGTPDVDMRSDMEREELSGAVRIDILQIQNRMVSARNVSKGADFLNSLVMEFCHPKERGEIFINPKDIKVPPFILPANKL